MYIVLIYMYINGLLQEIEKSPQLHVGVKFSENKMSGLLLANDLVITINISILKPTLKCAIVFVFKIRRSFTRR